jgi:hypothetical protein
MILFHVTPFYAQTLSVSTNGFRSSSADHTFEFLLFDSRFQRLSLQFSCLMPPPNILLLDGVLFIPFFGLHICRAYGLYSPSHTKISGLLYEYLA